MNNLLPDYACKYILECPNVKIMGTGLPEDEFTKFSNQYLELCLSAGHNSCGLYQKFEKEKRVKNNTRGNK